MGVPKFYRWISERYPLINQLVSNSAVLPEFDNFYLDMNGIIHACTHPSDNLTANNLSLREMMLSIFRYVDRMVSEIVKPKKLLFMAIDGVAPRAKLNQQRSRRFRAAQERTASVDKARQRGEVIDEDELFDSNCITPGTEFMETVSRHLKWYIRKKIKEDPLWRNLTIIFSGHDVPGEGEHKIMQYIRDMRAKPDYEPNIRHCMYGQDADLIMLGLATHEPHFALLREVINFSSFKDRRSARETVMKQTKDAQFQLLHLSILREYITIDFGYGLPFPVDPERLIDDFIFMTFLVGNDFLPHLPTLDISEHAFDVLINAYREIMTENPGYIVENGDIKDFSRLEKLFSIIGSKENEILLNREAAEKAYKSKRKNNPDAMTQEELEELESALQENYELALAEAMDSNNVDETTPKAENSESSKDFRGRYYYEKFKLLPDSKDGAQPFSNLMRHYLRGLIWCLAYYVKGCISWTWYYPYHYGPMLQDMKNLSVLASEITFSLEQPFTPFQQLLGCLPPASSKLLPRCYQWLMLSELSPVYSFYPVEFDIDMDGKKNPWEAVVLLDFIDENKLLAAELSQCPESKLTRSEIHRNNFGKLLVHNYDPSVTDSYPSCNPDIGLSDIHHSHCKVIEEIFSLAPGHYFKPELLPGTIYPIAGYPSLSSMKLKDVQIKNVKLNIFGSESRYKSVVLGIDSPKIEHFDEKMAKLLLGRDVFINYPQIHESKVIAISTPAAEIRLDLNREGEVESNAETLVIKHDEATLKKWMKESETEASNYLRGRGIPGSGGLDIGSIQIFVKVRPLQGLKRDPFTGKSKKVYSRNHEALVPIQLALWTPPVKDLRYQESEELPIEDLMPIGSKIVAVQGQLLGYLGVVVGPHTKGVPNTKSGNNKKLVDVEFHLPPQREPQFGHYLSSNIIDTYHSTKYICSHLKISPSVLGKIVGSIRIEPDRFDLGLNLKKNGVYQLLGYARKVTPPKEEEKNGKKSQIRSVWETEDLVTVIGMDIEDSKLAQKAIESDGSYWEYSSATYQLLDEYKTKFPMLFSQLEKLEHKKEYKTKELLGSDSANVLIAIDAWMKSQLYFKLPRTPLSTVSLSRDAMKAIEKAADEFTTMNKSKEHKPHLVKGIPIDKVYCDAHRTSHDVALDFNKLEPRLGDRVVNLTCTGVPFGLKGTVITIHTSTKYVEVLFDEEFVGGKSLDGSCSQFRGRLCPWSGLLLIPLDNNTKFPIYNKEAEIAEKIHHKEEVLGKEKAKKIIQKSDDDQFYDESMDLLINSTQNLNLKEITASNGTGLSVLAEAAGEASTNEKSLSTLDPNYIERFFETLQISKNFEPPRAKPSEKPETKSEGHHVNDKASVLKNKLGIKISETKTIENNDQHSDPVSSTAQKQAHSGDISKILINAKKIPSKSYASAMSTSNASTEKDSSKDHITSILKNAKTIPILKAENSNVEKPPSTTVSEPKHITSILSKAKTVAERKLSDTHNSATSTGPPPLAKIAKASDKAPVNDHVKADQDKPKSSSEPHQPAESKHIPVAKKESKSISHLLRNAKEAMQKKKASEEATPSPSDIPLPPAPLLEVPTDAPLPPQPPVSTESDKVPEKTQVNVVGLLLNAKKITSESKSETSVIEAPAPDVSEAEKKVPTKPKLFVPSKIVVKKATV